MTAPEKGYCPGHMPILASAVGDPIGLETSTKKDFVAYRSLEFHAPTQCSIMSNTAVGALDN